MSECTVEVQESAVQLPSSKQNQTSSRFLHPSSRPASSCTLGLGVSGLCWSLPQLLWGEGRLTPWSSRWFTAGPHCKTNKRPHSVLRFIWKIQMKRRRNWGTGKEATQSQGEDPRVELEQPQIIRISPVTLIQPWRLKMTRIPGDPLRQSRRRCKVHSESRSKPQPSWQSWPLKYCLVKICYNLLY